MTLTDKDKQLATQLQETLKKHFENGCVLSEETLKEILEEQVNLVLDEIKFCIKTAEGDSFNEETDEE